MAAAAQPPLAIAGLSRLQRACLSCGGESQGPLPNGPWAGSLRQLGAPYGMLLLSSELLAAAGRLERLGVLGGKAAYAAAPSDASRRFWRWCAEHSPLRQLKIEMYDNAPAAPSFVAATHDLRNARPTLQVQCTASLYRFEKEFELEV